MCSAVVYEANLAKRVKSAVPSHFGGPIMSGDLQVIFNKPHGLGDKQTANDFIAGMKTGCGLVWHAMHVILTKQW
eukprot:scaffold639865_cov34-Prasinocladus_malaysianus.AAC.1